MSVKKLPYFFEDPKQLHKKVVGALDYYELPEEVTLERLEQWIDESVSPAHFIAYVFKEAYFESETEAEKLLDLLTRLWNVTPRRELGGLSPQQKLVSPGGDQPKK